MTESPFTLQSNKPLLWWSLERTGGQTVHVTETISQKQDVQILWGCWCCNACWDFVTWSVASTLIWCLYWWNMLLTWLTGTWAHSTILITLHLQMMNLIHTVWAKSRTWAWTYLHWKFWFNEVSFRNNIEEVLMLTHRSLKKTMLHLRITHLEYSQWHVLTSLWTGVSNSNSMHLFFE